MLVLCFPYLYAIAVYTTIDYTCIHVTFAQWIFIIYLLVLCLLPICTKCLYYPWIIQEMSTKFAPRKYFRKVHLAFLTTKLNLIKLSSVSNTFIYLKYTNLCIWIKHQQQLKYRTHFFKLPADCIHFLAKCPLMHDTYFNVSQYLQY